MTRAEQAQRTRQAVLDTSRQLFAERGFSGTSLQDIADAMGVRKANVYYYFKTKAAILEVLLDERVIALESLLDEAEAATSSEARRQLVVAAYVDNAVTAYRSVAPVDFADPAVRSQPKVTERVDALMSRFAAAVFEHEPTVDQLAGLAVLQDLKPVLRALDQLPDAELSATLQRLCHRLLT